MTKAQPRHPSTGRYVKGTPVKQTKPKAGTEAKKPMPKATKKQYS